MEVVKSELSAVKEVVDNAVELQLAELNDLQLALVGGGSGDVIIV